MWNRTYPGKGPIRHLSGQLKCLFSKCRNKHWNLRCTGQGGNNIVELPMMIDLPFPEGLTQYFHIFAQVGKWSCLWQAVGAFYDQPVAGPYPKAQPARCKIVYS